MITEIIPVIHKISDEQVKTNIETCLSCGINKIFLIDHGSYDFRTLLNNAISLKEEYGIWIGVNFLGLKTIDSIALDIPIDGMWCDSTLSIADSLAYRKFKGQLFGGLAFKYQPQPIDIAEACNEAKIATNVATTSGPGTGKAASIAKIENLRNLLGDHPLAIASGVSSDNISQYIGLVNYLLVASSITSMQEFIIKDKLSELIDKLIENK